MATTLQMPPEHLTDSALSLVSPQSASEMYSRGLPVPQLDYKDSRYPTLPKAASPPVIPSSYVDRAEDLAQAESSRRTWLDYSSPNNTYAPSGWFPDKSIEEVPIQHIASQPHQMEARASPVHPSQQPPPSHSSLTPTVYPALGEQSGYSHISRSPEGQRAQHMSSNSGSASPPSEPNRIPIDVVGSSVVHRATQDNMGQRISSMDIYQDRSSSLMPSTPRHPSLPLAGVGNAGPSSPTLSPIVPLSAGPSFNPASMAIPVSPKPRAYPQQPTFINPSSASPAYAPPQVPKEEVCVECAMRDQDMADVDVTSPGVWERESDAYYEDLCRREADEETSGVSSSDHSSKPRAKGGLLTEANLKLWLSVVRRYCEVVMFNPSFPTRSLFIESEGAVISDADAGSVCPRTKSPFRSRSYGTCPSHARIAPVG